MHVQQGDIEGALKLTEEFLRYGQQNLFDRVIKYYITSSHAIRLRVFFNITKL
jgi:hypothetical protein